ncbi:MAG: hypothetical protein A2252_10185 [Elusimicrobia bacterium RIFOXYA2_FULL_39_19]|nr:MAG: hypothetical protein A2252_10185 [Elusimicrobia bacterium RIFOXYA2_FULL_39_19]
MNEIFSSVKKPARYTNSEFNSIHKAHAKVKACLCFPDLYELGASNLGLEILYHIINSIDYSSTERCYCPDIDLEEILRKENIKLFSLESKKPLKEFDFIGFTLQYELCFTNILTMLDLAGIPIKSKDRTGTQWPLIIAGGPVSFNPGPVSDLFDLFVIGDGEDVIKEILREIKAYKEKPLQKETSKNELLLALSKIQGIYIPVIHKDQRNLEIVKRTVDIKKSFYPINPIVPFIQTVHSRYNVEISRGCVHNCRFCQASSIYGPYRERTPDQIFEYVNDGIKNTGYDEISLGSLSVSSYSKIDSLIENINRYCINKKVSLSLPSLRCDNRSIKLLPCLIYPQRANLTFAIEAGSQKLRSSIAKGISDNDIYNTMRAVDKMGWKLVKLYFMIGLPGETKEDIEAIIILVKQLTKLTPRIQYNITISPFVPKAHTGFQWEKMEDIVSLNAKKDILMKNLRGNLKAHNVRMSVLEGTFARGNNKLLDVIIGAWKKGARFDHWFERFKPDAWDEAFRENGVEKDEFLNEIQDTSILPWGFIKTNKSSDYFEDEKNKSKIGILEKEIKADIIEEDIVLEKPIQKQEDSNNVENSFVYRLVFTRGFSVRYLSHLEQVELFRRVLKRAGLPLKYSKGFHPHMDISLGPAISVGYESDNEIVDIETTKQLDLRQASEFVLNNLPKGYSLSGIRQLYMRMKSVDSLVSIFEYSILGLDTLFEVQKINEILTEYEKNESVIIEYIKHEKKETADLKEKIYKIDYKSSLSIFLRKEQKNNIKPENVLLELFKLKENDFRSIRIIRKNLYTHKDNVLSVIY